MSQDFNKKVANATKWSGITEIIAKLINPICNMLLARILTPEAFGIVATLTVVTSFAELFTDAGFQRYLVQHEFRDETELDKSTNVAFWSNFSISLFIWGIVAVFADPIATLVGSSGLGLVLIVFFSIIPLSAFSSIQMSLYRRKLDFKKLLKVRIVSILTPLFVTVPLALLFRNYWALVIGTIAQSVVNAIILTYYSDWHPRLYFSFLRLKEMLSFTLWTLFESVSIWLTNYIDVFIVGTTLSKYYLGLYITSSAVSGQILGLITAITSPVLFSALSRLQNNEIEFRDLFFKFEKIVGLLVIPMGVGIFCFSDLVTDILLGNQWVEASGFIGLWSLMSTLTIVLSNYASEVYRAKGKPKLSALAQWLHIIVLWPVILIAVKCDFETLYISRSLIRLELIAVNLVILYQIIHINPISMIRNIAPSIASSLVMMAMAFFLLSINNTILWQIISVVICAVIYTGIISLFKNERVILRTYLLKKWN